MPEMEFSRPKGVPRIWPSEEWELADPRETGLDPATLASVNRVLSAPGSNAAAFLVVQHGKIVAEQYYQGFDVTDRMHLFSVTKSVLSALFGIALQEGALHSVDQPVLDFFPEVQPASANPLRLLTLRHLLSMASGMLWPVKGWREIMVERMRHSPDWVQFILGLPVRREEIGRFHYCSAASHLLSAILTRAVGMSTGEYACQRLFAPLGIANVVPGSDWETDPQGVTLGGWGLHLTARELARFGWLYLMEGQWCGQCIVPQGWVQVSTRPAAGLGYGYQWWLRSAGPEAVFAGRGVGGQHLFCVPARQMVVVILSRFTHRWPERWNVLEALLSNGHGG